MAKPIFCIAHPRACSTAFERVFMTRTKDMTCVHEPFGDAFYFGPERMSDRYEKDEASRQNSGFCDSTYKSILDHIDNEGSEGKRLFLKDISCHLVPPYGKAAQIAPSLVSKRRGIGTETNGLSIKKSSEPPFPYGTETEPGNPSVLPEELLNKFHFTFLIRDPHNSIPSYYRCTIPPLKELTGFHYFDPSEAGYLEQKRIFDYLKAQGRIGPKQAGQAVNGTNGHVENGVNGHTNGINGATPSGVEICVVDADDLLDDPEAIIKEYCRSVNLDYSPSMLNWDSEESHTRAKTAFEKWKGFHEDAIDSRDLKPRAHKKKRKTEDEWDAEWKAKYGDEGAKLIRETVDANMEDYFYLKQFAMRI